MKFIIKTKTRIKIREKVYKMTKIGIKILLFLIKIFLLGLFLSV